MLVLCLQLTWGRHKGIVSGRETEKWSGNLMNLAAVASCIIVVIKATIPKHRADQSLIDLWNGRGLEQIWERNGNFRRDTMQAHTPDNNSHRPIINNTCIHTPASTHYNHNGLDYHVRVDPRTFKTWSRSTAKWLSISLSRTATFLHGTESHTCNMQYVIWCGVIVGIAWGPAGSSVSASDKINSTYFEIISFSSSQSGLL